MTLALARITVTARTVNGRPVVTLPKAGDVRITVRQLAALMQEARDIKALDG